MSIVERIRALMQWGWRWKTDPHASTRDVGLLILRLVAGGFMAFGHGWGKLTSYSERVDTWADPIGLGSEVSLTLAVFAEFFCALFVLVGFGTRGAVIPVVITMAVAGFIVHGDDPFSRQEKALLFLAAFAVIGLTGAGRYSIDGWLERRRSAQETTT